MMKMKPFMLALLFWWSGTAIYAQSESITTTTTTNSSRNTSITESKTNSDYHYLAVFDKDKTEQVKAFIVKSFGKAHEESERSALWEENGYCVELRQGRVRIEAEKDKVSRSIWMKTADLGESITEVLGSQRIRRSFGEKNN